MTKAEKKEAAERKRLEIKNRLMKTLYGHVGATKMIGMGELFETVFAEGFNNRINDTRVLRLLITELRKEGIPIVSVVSQTGGGYYIASSASELEAYCSRITTAALKKLKLVAGLKKMGLPALVGEIQMNLGGENGAGIIQS